jgi:hypothetical protein
MSTLREQTLAEAYQDMKGLIIRTAMTFNKRYGGDLDEQIAEANRWFVHAVDTWNPAKAKLTTWIYWCVWNRLQIHRMGESTYHYHNQYAEELIEPTHDPGEDLPSLEQSKHHPKAKDEIDKTEELLDQVSDSARQVICLILFPPEEIEHQLIGRGHQYGRARKCLRRYLAERFHWTIREIRETFREIELALKD